MTVFNNLNLKVPLILAILMFMRFFLILCSAVLSTKKVL